MKKNIMGAALILLVSGAKAQETYESAQLATHDLNGTAKYVAMGGAMEALGADISTIASNPAGIGLFRRTWAGISGGVTIQSGNSVSGLSKSGKTNADLNQVGFVYAMSAGANSFLNLGFNFHKNRNFNQIISAVNSLDTYSSANKVALMKFMKFSDFTALSAAERMTYNTINYQYYEALGQEYYRGAESYVAQRDNSGYIGEYDFNISGNINDRVYLGITFGIKDVHYESQLAYAEDLGVDSQFGDGLYGLSDERTITGSGFDVKFGAIFRPMEESPFRFGLYINTPTWYSLTCHTNMKARGAFALNDDLKQTDSNTYDYKIVTPWKFGVSLGHTFGQDVAVGLTYEFADYGSMKNKIVDGYSYYSGTVTENDKAMDNNTKNSLKGVHLLKIGAEYKPTPKLALRLGYNFESALYDSDGNKDYAISSDLDTGSVGSYYSTFDYTNWKATQRITFGVGYSFSKNWTADISYQFITQKGDFHPFQTLTDDQNLDFPCYGTTSSVTSNRHMINCTLGYRF